MKDAWLLLQHSFSKGLTTLDILDFGDVAFLVVTCQYVGSPMTKEAGIDIHSQPSLPRLLASYRHAGETW